MNTTIRTVLIAALAAATSACGGYGAPKQATSSNVTSGSHGSPGSYDSGGDSGDHASAPDSAAPDAPSASGSAAPARSSVSTSADSHGDVARHETPHQPTERPGLGTVWGEDMHSRVQTTSFYRAQSHPFAQVALHYNDSQGAQAHAAYRGGARPVPMYVYSPHRGVSISLVDIYGRVLPGLSAAGRTLVIGQHGQQYKIRITNSTGGRYEVVTSVDGLDVIDGKKADLRKRGYIIGPNSTVVIDGFRRSDSTVAAFRFGSVRNSYAARTSGDRNVGVIGVALFAERGSYWTSDEIRQRDTANPFPGDHGYARPPY